MTLTVESQPPLRSTPVRQKLLQRTCRKGGTDKEGVGPPERTTSAKSRFWLVTPSTCGTEKLTTSGDQETHVQNVTPLGVRWARTALSAVTTGREGDLSLQPRGRCGAEARLVQPATGRRNRKTRQEDATGRCAGGRDRKTWQEDVTGRRNRKTCGRARAGGGPETPTSAGVC